MNGNCGCAGTASKKNTAGGMVQDSSDMYLKSNFLTGFSHIFELTKDKTLAVKKLRVPNTVVVAENPCLAIGTGIIFENKELAGCITNFAQSCYTVTSPPVLVGTEWSFQIDAIWGSATPGVTEFPFQTALGYEGCGTEDAAKSLLIRVCSGQQNPANWSGILLTAPLNSEPISGPVSVTTGSRYITITDTGTRSKNFRCKVGDSVAIDNTAINGANTAVVMAVYNDGQILLDRDVTGINIAPNPTTGKVCVRATSQPRAIANFLFEGICKCGIKAIIDRSITSASTFPTGTPFDNSGRCPSQEYCFVIWDRTPNAETPVYSGIIEFN
jgi:hypothetical protein